MVEGTPRENPDIYAVKHKDDDVRMNSRSGGFFTALSDFVLDRGGVVYGCILTDTFEAVHIRADSRKVRDAMRGSKYVQSRMQDVFAEVKKDLQDDQRWVLFTGTPCQVSGLKGFLHGDYERLILADILCHGVASPKVWRQYLAWQEEKHGACTGVDFRDKKDFGWADHVETLRFGDQSVHSQVFTFIYYGHWALRPCCYQCPFRSLHREGDVSMADYWEIDRAYPGFNDNKGVSLVFINRDKGAKIFDAVKEDLEWKQTRLEDSTRPSMLHPFPEPKDRSLFWKDFLHGSFGKVVRKYTGHGLLSRLSRKVDRVRLKIDGPRTSAARAACCGCTACYAACPTQAISMQPDEEGFLYPVVNADQCTRCNQCLAVCAFRRKLDEYSEFKK